MRLCIADPPYLGTAEMLYGPRPVAALARMGGGRFNKADEHPEAHLWDIPATHEAMVNDLIADYDGWVIALRPQELRHYLQWVPADTRVAVWHKPTGFPNGSHPQQHWEAVLVSRPPGRYRVADVPVAVHDVMTCTPPNDGFAGSKPLRWVEWVLAMMGYCPTHDTVDDLFHGSGAIANALNQGRLIECKCQNVSSPG